MSTPSLSTFVSTIAPLSEKLKATAQHKINFKTKPLGSLGTLEDIAVQMATIQKTLDPTITHKAMFTFAADHGIAEEGVSAFPQEVTQQMVLNFLNNGAAINVLCKHNDIKLSVIDVGVKGQAISHPNLISKPIASGTTNFSKEQAMSKDQAIAALTIGREHFIAEHAKKPLSIIGLGEMGIGNTTTATAIISAISDKPVKECTGSGTGVTEETLLHKISIIENALALHKPNTNDALDVLCKVGGFEIAAMAGAALAAAEHGCAVVLDGLISTAAGLIAFSFNPIVAEYCIAGHKSVERGHIYALETMGLTPILDLNFRLGEGTGAALAINIVDAACAIMREMASFESAGVSNVE
ncbi:MAG: nicotinate-nucleotide--dimethylbenzimidazole phosphoribosyltransferase [Fibrobacterales bacterium]